MDVNLTSEETERTSKFPLRECGGNTPDGPPETEVALGKAECLREENSHLDVPTAAVGSSFLLTERIKNNQKL